MSRDIRVAGREPAREAYCIETESGAAYVPECLMSRRSDGTRPSHQSSYQWISAHHRDIRRAVATRVAGKTPRTPFDLITLIEEA